MRIQYTCLAIVIIIVNWLVQSGLETYAYAYAYYAYFSPIMLCCSAQILHTLKADCSIRVYSFVSITLRLFPIMLALCSMLLTTYYHASQALAF